MRRVIEKHDKGRAAPLLHLSRSPVDIKAQLVPPASLVHDVLPLVSCCSVLDDTGLLGSQVLRRLAGANQWWTKTNPGTAKPPEARHTSLGEQSTGTLTRTSGSSGLDRSSSPRKNSGGLSGRLPGSGDQHCLPWREQAPEPPLHRDSPFNIERAKPHGPPRIWSKPATMHLNAPSVKVDCSPSTGRGRPKAEGLASGAPRRHN